MLNYQLNNEEPASTAGSSNVEVQSIGFPGVSSLAGLPPRTFKILAEHPLIVLFSVLGMSSLISSSVVIFIYLAAPFHMCFPHVSLLLLLLG